MPPTTLARLGLALLLVASTIYFLAGRWLHSRICTPLDYSVSLESRQLKSPPFLINLRDEYFVSLRLGDATNNWEEAQRCSDSNLLGSEWRIYKLSSKAAQLRVLWADSARVEREYELYIGTNRHYDSLVRDSTSWNGICHRVQPVFTSDMPSLRFTRGERAMRLWFHSYKHAASSLSALVLLSFFLQLPAN